MSAVRAALVALMLVGLSAPSASAEPDPHLIDARVYAGVHSADYSTVAGLTQSFLAARASAGAGIGGPLRIRVDALGGRFSSGDLAAAGALRAYAQTERFLVGSSYAYSRITGGLDSHMLALHGEVHEADLMTVTSSFGFEKRTFGDDVGFGEVILRFYVGDRVVLAPGASYAVSNLKQTRADILLRGEWTLFASTAISLGVYAQYGGNLFTKALAGLLVFFDGTPPRIRERRDGLTMARFD